mgnify:CR=1 FL=1
MTLPSLLKEGALPTMELIFLMLEAIAASLDLPRSIICVIITGPSEAIGHTLARGPILVALEGSGIDIGLEKR